MSDTTENMMGSDDMIFQNVNGTRYTGNYKIHNMFKDSGVGPYSYIQHGGSSEILMSSMFENLAVPTGLLFLQQSYPSKSKDVSLKQINEKVSVIKDDLYSSLLDLVGTKKQEASVKKETKKNTRRLRKESNKKSRKRR